MQKATTPPSEDSVVLNCSYSGGSTLVQGQMGTVRMKGGRKWGKRRKHGIQISIHNIKIKIHTSPLNRLQAHLKIWVRILKKFEIVSRSMRKMKDEYFGRKEYLSSKCGNAWIKGKKIPISIKSDPTMKGSKYTLLDFKIKSFCLYTQMNASPTYLTDTLINNASH